MGGFPDDTTKINFACLGLLKALVKKACADYLATDHVVQGRLKAAAAPEPL